MNQMSSVVSDLFVLRTVICESNENFCENRESNSGSGEHVLSAYMFVGPL